ncbi:MAG: HpcH/HpaI aldolase/citrate lyase family protein [Candidatus Geothermarchaeales archaeon]
MSAPRLLRTMLFVPGNSWRMIHRATKEREDAVILDLEDAVPMGEKETARWFIKDAIGLLKAEDLGVFVRVNGLATGLTAEDLQFAVQEGLDGIVLPKSESKDDMIELERLIEKEEESKGLRPESIAIVPLMETAKGVLNARGITTATRRVIASCFGAGDYMRDLGRSYITMSPEETEILYARSYVALASRVAGIPAIDTPFFGLITDREGLVRESRMAAQLGFKGKQVIHPTHIDPVNEVFSPSPEEVESAKKIIEAYEEASARGLGAASHEGRMIDYATYAMAQELMSVAETIAERDKRRG